MRNTGTMSLVLQLLLSFILLSCSNESGSKAIDKEPPPQEVPNQDGDFQLNLLIHGASNDVVKLLGVYGNRNFLVDSAVGDANGNFVFAIDSLMPPGFYYLMLTSDNSYFQLLIDKDQHFGLEATKGDYVNTLKFSNSLDNDLLYKNLRFESGFNKRLEAVNNQIAQLTDGTPQFNAIKKQQDGLVKEREEHIQWFVDNHPDAFFTKFKLSGQNPKLTYPKNPNGEVDTDAQLYQYKKAFWDNVDLTDANTLRTPVFANKLRKFIKELTPQSADSLIKYADVITTMVQGDKELFKYTVNWIAIEYKTPKTMGTEALYVHMIDKYWTQDLAFWSNPEEIKGLRGEISLMKPSLIGQIGQDIQAINEEGENISLYSLRAPIKVLFIYSYDCEHCQKETPEMVRVYNQWKNRGIDVFTLCTDKEKGKWLDFVAKNGMPFKNTYDPERKSRYDRKYHIDITPELYVLNRDNKIIASNLSPNQLPDFLEGEYEKNPW